MVGKLIPIFHCFNGRCTARSIIRLIPVLNSLMQVNMLCFPALVTSYRKRKRLLFVLDFLNFKVYPLAFSFLGKVRLLNSTRPVLKPHTIDIGSTNRPCLFLAAKVAPTWQHQRGPLRRKSGENGSVKREPPACCKVAQGKSV